MYGHSHTDVDALATQIAGYVNDSPSGYLQDYKAYAIADAWLSLAAIKAVRKFEDVLRDMQLCLAMEGCRAGTVHAVADMVFKAFNTVRAAQA